MKQQSDLGNDPVFSLVLKLAVPTMIANFVTVLYNIVDRMFIGNIPEVGTLALAGAGVCGPVVTLLTSFGTLVGLGGSILFAMRLGAGKENEAENILANSFLMLSVLSVGLTILFLLFKNRLLMWFGASEATFPYANTYMTIYTAGTVFALMSIGLNYFIISQGFATIGMITVLIGSVTNILLDPLFIFGFDMGIAGAAIATVLAQMFSCLFALFFLFSRRVPINITFGGYTPAVMKRILQLGLSPFLILASDSIIMIVLNASLQYHGGTAQGDLLITAATISQSYLLIITAPLLGISSGTQAILSFNYGAKAVDRIKKAERWILLFCLAFTTFMFAVTQFVPAAFSGIFTSDETQIAMAVRSIRISTLAIIPLSFQYAFVDGLTALDRTKTALCLSMIRKCGYALFASTLPFFFGAQNAFFAQPLADTISSVISTITFMIVFPIHMRHLLPS